MTMQNISSAHSTVSPSATLLVVCIAYFLMPFMMSAVGIALPAIGREFTASAKDLSLIETTYVLSSSIFLLSVGRLADIYGRKRFFKYGIVIFTLACGLISQCWSVESMILFRFLQGMGGAMVMATSMAILTSVFPAEERGRALGIAVASVYAGISCGPFIGGNLVTSLGWRSIFYLSVPLGITLYIVLLKKLQGEWADAAGEPFDLRGSLIYAASILLLLHGVANLGNSFWATYATISGVAGLILFIKIESNTDYPILDINLLKQNRVFALSNLASLFNYAATFGVTFFLSLYLQYIKGMSPREAGLILIIQPITQSIFSPLCGMLADRYQASKVATFGMGLCVLGLMVAATIEPSTPMNLIYMMLVLLGLGFALFSSPNMSVIMGSVQPQQLGIASGLASSMRTLGMMASMTIITLIFSVLLGGHGITPNTHHNFILSMKLALTIFSILCITGIICSWKRQE